MCVCAYYIYIYIHTLVHRLGHGFRWHFESYLCVDRAFVGLEVYVDYMGFCDLCGLRLVWSGLLRPVHGCLQIHI